MDKESQKKKGQEGKPAEKKDEVKVEEKKPWDWCLLINE